jgi:hypothetical protein
MYAYCTCLVGGLHIMLEALPFTHKAKVLTTIRTGNVSEIADLVSEKELYLRDKTLAIMANHEQPLITATICQAVIQETELTRQKPLLNIIAKRNSEPLAGITLVTLAINTHDKISEFAQVTVEGLPEGQHKELTKTLIEYFKKVPDLAPTLMAALRSPDIINLNDCSSNEVTINYKKLQELSPHLGLLEFLDESMKLKEIGGATVEALDDPNLSSLCRILFNTNHMTTKVAIVGWCRKQPIELSLPFLLNALTDPSVKAFSHEDKVHFNTADAFTRAAITLIEADPELVIAKLVLSAVKKGPVGLQLYANHALKNRYPDLTEVNIPFLVESCAIQLRSAYDHYSEVPDKLIPGHVMYPSDSCSWIDEHVEPGYRVHEPCWHSMALITKLIPEVYKKQILSLCGSSVEEIKKGINW